MIARAIAIVLGIALAGCATTEQPRQLRLTAELDRSNETIGVRLVGLRPAENVTRVRLSGPQNQRIAPIQRSRHRGVRARHALPTVGVQARGGSASGIDPGLTLSLDLFDWSWGGSETVAQRSVTATFAIPDGYRRDPDGWHVEAVVTNPTGQQRTYRTPVAGR
jgi:hypothetical protein